MKVVEKMDVDADRLFDHLLDSIRFDYREATGKELKDTRLKRGLGYRKRLRAKAGGEREVAVKVTELERPSVYEASFTSSQGVNTIRWDIAPAEEGGVTVTYTEAFAGARTLDTLNGKLTGAIMSAGSRRRIRQRLRAIARYLAEAEEGDAPAAPGASADTDDRGGDRSLPEDPSEE